MVVGYQTGVAGDEDDVVGAVGRGGRRVGRDGDAGGGDVVFLEGGWGGHGGGGGMGMGMGDGAGGWKGERLGGSGSGKDAGLKVGCLRDWLGREGGWDEFQERKREKGRRMTLNSQSTCHCIALLNYSGGRTT